jgi:AraC-like DNA-binding protein
LAASRNPDLGIDRELAARHIDFDAVGYATLSSADLRSALAELARYLALISSATTFRLQPQGADCWLVMGHTGFRRPLPPQRSGYSVLALLTLCRWISRRQVEPLEARFGFACPGNPEVWRTAFGCPVEFAAADHRLLLAAADIDAPLPTRNADLLVLHEQVLDKELAALADERVAPRVSEEIVRRLAGGEPRRQDVAASLAMTDRTLQRRLQAEQTSFQQLLDEARRELAARYLADPRYALGEVAHMLGFADPSNFFRACRRWFGQPPGHWREQHQRAA